jgi:hypothetical protein
LTPKNVENIRNFREEEEESGPIYIKDNPGDGGPTTLDFIMLND